MALKNDFELENTRKKLRLLEERYEESLRETGGDEYLRAVSRRTVKRWINRMTEEIIRYEIQKKAAAARVADSVPVGSVPVGSVPAGSGPAGSGPAGSGPAGTGSS